MIKLEQFTQADIALLPHVVQELVGLIGLTATMRLVEHHGGTSILIPQGKNREGQIAFEAMAEVVGYKEMTLLAKHFKGNDVLYVANCKAAIRAVRNRLIRRDFDAYTLEESGSRAVMKLARDHQLSDRRVWEILKEADVVCATQVSLF
ncbi:Mor transcription activator family protein [Iodobacter sp.]|uniref:Mor transcription activator family protein n=1 Tax=Iodobacter sp. TaxID=1915058 RepID=UPI0025FDAA3F|nr:Mor transcription activator family protein [Iodobacter sp.]